MECVSQENEIKVTFDKVSEFSYREKRDPLVQEKAINDLLDAVLEFKKNLSAKTLRINNLVEGLERLTWLNDLNDHCLKLMNDLISSSNDLHSSLIRQYVRLNNLKKKKIALDQIKAFKLSIDDLKETTNDLESVFFHLPKMKEFQETSKKLSLLK